MDGIAGLGAAVAGVRYAPLPRDLEGACRALEREFALLVFRTMRRAMVPRSSKGSSAFARETAYGLLDAQWADLASRGEGLGLWKAMLRQLGGAVKETRAGADQERGGEPHRTEAEDEPQGGAGIPGAGTGRARSAPAAAPGARVPGVPAAAGRVLDRSA